MAEETPVTPTRPSPKPAPETPPGPIPEKVLKKKKLPGKWFRRIPKEILLSPGGIVLIFVALIMEIIDWIPLPGLDCLTWEMILEIIFCGFLAIIAKLPFQSMIIPFIIERLPVVSDILPTWLIRMFF